MAKVNLDNLQKFVDKRLISVQKHPEADLFIYNYTPKAQFDKVWTEETMMCRGLIVEKDGLIVARPFKKFFNLAEHEVEDIPHEPFDVYEKLDGSLGILYHYNGMPFIATRGSFTSEQAVEATKILRYKYFDVSFNPSWTYLFEIIYPQNRIVVSYGDIRDLYLLAVIDTQTGEEVRDLHSDLIYGWKPGGLKNKFPIPKSYNYKSLDEVKELMSKGKGEDEGFVIRFKSGMRVKVKYDEYVRLHRLITGVTVRRIWDLLRNGQSLDEMKEKVPEEFLKWVNATEKNLKNNYAQVLHDAQVMKTQVQELPTRKEQAEFVLNEFKYPSVIFHMLDKKDYAPIIWKIIKPAVEKPFKDVGEDI